MKVGIRERSTRRTALGLVAAVILGLFGTVAGAGAAAGDVVTVTLLPDPASAGTATPKFTQGSELTAAVRVTDSSGTPRPNRTVDLLSEGGPAQGPDNDILPLRSTLKNNAADDGRTNAAGFAYFRVRAQKDATLRGKTTDDDTSGTVALVVLPRNALTDRTVVSTSIGRVVPGGSGTATVVVQARNDAGPVAEQEVALVSTIDNPHPITAQPFGTGFGEPNTRPKMVANGLTRNGELRTRTDSAGVAVFTISNTEVDDLAYFTPYFDLGGGAVAIAQDTAAVTFSTNKDTKEATLSQVQLTNPACTGNGDCETGPTEITAPADGTTAVPVYVSLRCECFPNGRFESTYKGDLFGGGSNIMPSPLGGNGDESGLRGSLVELRPQSEGSHAVITPVNPSFNNNASNVPLDRATGQAYSGQDPDDRDVAGEDAKNTGIAVFQVTNSVAEEVTLQGFDFTTNTLITGDPQKMTSGSVTIRFLAPSPYMPKSRVVATPATVPADGLTPSSIRVKVRDVAGNPISGRTIELRASGTDLGPGLEPSAEVANGAATTGLDGEAKFSVSNSVAETVTFTATDQQSGMVGSVQVRFSAAPPSLTTSTIAIAPDRVTADGTSTATVTVNLQDAGGNPAAGLPVKLTQADGGRATISPPTATTSTGGNAVFTVTNTKVEDVYFSARTGERFELVGTTPVSFVAGNVSQARSALAADLNSVPADGTTPVTVSVAVRDPRDNPISERIVRLTGNGATAVIAPTTGVETDDNGIARFTVRNATPEQVTFTATDVTETATPLQLGTIVLTFSGDPVPACPGAVNQLLCSAVGALTPSAAANAVVGVSAVVRDANGFPVGGRALSLITSGSAYQVAQSPAGGVTGPDGTVTYLVSSSAPGRVGFTVLDGTVALGTATITFFGAPAAMNTGIDVNPTQVPADGSSAATVTVRVRDVNDNAVVGQLVVLDSDSTSAVVVPAGAAFTDPTGLAGFTVKNTRIERVTLRASAGDLLTDPVSISFVQARTEAGNSTVTASPGTVVADDVAASTVTVTLRAPDNDPLVGSTVALSCPQATVTPATQVSGSGGKALFAVKSTQVGVVTCTATDSDAGVVLLQTPQITFVAVPSEANRSTVDSSASIVPNDGTTATVTVVLRGADGNVLTGNQVSLSANAGSSTIVPASATSDVTGTVRFTVSNLVAQTVTYTARDTTTDVVLDERATVVFSDEKTASTVSVAPAAVPADGRSTASITVTLRAAGRPVVGHQVTLIGLNGVSRIKATKNPTGADGKAVFQVSDGVAEVVRYRVVDSTLGLTLAAEPQVGFTAAGPAPQIQNLSPDSGPAGQVVTITGANLAGASVSFGGVPAQTVSINPAGTQVRATAPGGSGRVRVTVATAGGTASAGFFTYGGS